MTTAQAVETSVTVNNSPIQDYIHPEDQTQPTFEMIPGFKPFTETDYFAHLKLQRCITSSVTFRRIYIFSRIRMVVSCFEVVRSKPDVRFCRVGVFSCDSSLVDDSRLKAVPVERA